MHYNTLIANYRGHIGGGVVLGVVYAAAVEVLPIHIYDAHLLLTNWQTVLGIVLLSTMFGLFPDVDTNSKAQNLFFAIAFLLDAALIVSGMYQAAAYLGLVAMMPILGKHRGWTHSKVAMVLVPSPLLIFPYLSTGTVPQATLIIYGAAVTGYFSHLLLDGLIFKHVRIKN